MPWRLLLAPPLFAILTLTAGCASSSGGPDPVPPILGPGERAAAVLESDVAVVYYPTPPFREVHPASGTGWPMSPLGSLFQSAMHRATSARLSAELGERIRVRYRLGDPMGRVRQAVLERLAIQLGTPSLRSTPERFLSTDQVADLKATFVSGIVLDFGTVGWGLVALPKAMPFTAEHYEVAYLVRMRLVRLGDSRILWQATCGSVRRSVQENWTMEQLTADDGALLKAKLNQAADECAAELLAQFIG